MALISVIDLQTKRAALSVQVGTWVFVSLVTGRLFSVIAKNAKRVLTPEIFGWLGEIFGRPAEMLAGLGEILAGLGEILTRQAVVSQNFIFGTSHFFVNHQHINLT